METRENAREELSEFINFGANRQLLDGMSSEDLGEVSDNFPYPENAVAVHVPGAEMLSSKGAILARMENIPLVGSGVTQFDQGQSTLRTEQTRTMEIEAVKLDGSYSVSIKLFHF